MTTPSEVVSGQEPLAPPQLPLDADQGGVSAFQEINARRARVENAELLAHLRGL